MKLRARLALTLGLATISSAGAAGLGSIPLAVTAEGRRAGGSGCASNGIWRTRALRGQPGTLAGSARGPGGSPASGPSRHRFPRHRVFAYDADFQSRNPDNPVFPPELAQQLAAGRDIASHRAPSERRTQVAVRMPWGEGPCAVVLMRAKGPASLVLRCSSNAGVSRRAGRDPRRALCRGSDRSPGAPAHRIGPKARKQL